MNFKKLFLMLTLLVLTGTMAFAQTKTWYVNHTNGDDANNNGSSSSPYQTITQAIGVASSGDIINIAADTYPENVTVPGSTNLTFLGIQNTANLNNTAVTITNFTVNPGSGGVVYMGADPGSYNFVITGTITLQSGSLNILTEKVSVSGTIERVAGSVNAAFTTSSNINVKYSGNAGLAAGPELPTSLGSGTLQFSNTAGTISVSSDLTFTTGQILLDAAGNATISGAVTFNSSNAPAYNATASVYNNGTGSLTISSLISFNRTTSSGTPVGIILNNGTGASNGLTISGGISRSNSTINVVNHNTGTLSIAGGTSSYNGTLYNDGNGTLTLVGNADYSGTDFQNTGTGIVKLNTYTLTLSGTGVTFVNANKMYAAASGSIGIGTLNITGTVTYASGSVNTELPNVTISGSGTFNVANLTPLAVASHNTATPTVFTTAGHTFSVGDIVVVTASTDATIIAGTLGKVNAAGLTGTAFTLSDPVTGASLTAATANLVTQVRALASVAVYGNYNQTSGANNALAFNDNRITISGNFTRTSTNPADVNGGTRGTLRLDGPNTQTFTPGNSLQLKNVQISKSGINAGIVNLQATVFVNGDFTIDTGCQLNLGNYNIRMNGTGTFRNNGSYSSAGTGYVVFEGTAGTLAGTGGTFGNTDVRVGSANTVTLSNNINFSGTLIIRSGTLALGANTVTLTSTNVPIPSIMRSITPTAQATVAGGSIALGSGVKYNLTYFGDDAVARAVAAGAEWTTTLATSINNLSVESSGQTHTVTGPAGNTTIAGTLNVSTNQSLILYSGGGTRSLISTGNVIHTLRGKLLGGTFQINGTNVTVNGASVAGDAAEIGTSTVAGNFLFDPLANNAVLTVNGLKTITGNVDFQTGSNIYQNATATFTMNSTTSVIGGHVTVGNVSGGAPTVSLSLPGGTTNTHSGNLVVTNGNLTYTRTANDNTIGGLLTLTAGTLTLGSDVTVTGASTWTAGTLNIGSYYYIQNGSAAGNDIDRTNATVSGTGTLVLDNTTAAINVNNGGGVFTIPNLYLIGAANGTTLASMTVSGSIYHESGVVTNMNTLTLTGNTYELETGTYSGGTLVFKGANTVATFQTDVTFPGLTINAAGGKVQILSDKETASTPVARNITVSGLLTQTDGDIELGINNLILTSGGASLARTAGSWNMSTGKLVLNNGGGLTFDPGNNWSIKNLDVQAAAAISTDKAWTVTGNLTLTAGAFTANGTTKKLIIGDNATIERVAGTLAAKPTFAGVVNMYYNAAAGASNVAITSYTATVASPFAAATFTLAGHGLVNGQILKLHVTNGTPTDGGNDGLIVYVADKTVNTFALKKMDATYVATTVNTDTYAFDNTGAGVTPGNEFPTTDIINNFTTGTFGKVILNSDLIVNGTLSLSNMLDAKTNDPGKEVTMADSTVLELKALGTVVLDEDLTKAGKMDLVYNGAGATSTRELGAISSGTYGTPTGNVIVKSNVTTDGKITLGGDLTFDGGNITLGNDINLTADLIQTTRNGGSGFFAGGAYFVNLQGDSSDISLKASQVVPAAVKIRLDKATNTTKVMLLGGDLNFGSGAVLYFKNGLLVTGTKNVILQQGVASGQPTQGFDRSGVTGTNASHIVGNVKKLLDITLATPAIRLTRVEFPVGTLPSSPAYYRPLALQFTTLPTASVNITVSHVNENPGGPNGFPIKDGDLTITNYPNFYWLVKSDLTLQPQVKYDIEARADGYTDYELDGIQNVRFVRRFDNNTSNPWIAQGGDGYDNSTDGTNPVVIVRGAEGAISSQGARFSYSQLNKAPVITPVADITKNEGDTLKVAWTVNDPDIGQTITVAATQKPETATFNASTKTLTWIIPNSAAGVHNIIISATDGYKTTYDTLKVTVLNVNRAPSFTATGAEVHATAAVVYGDSLVLAYKAIDGDTDDVLTYSLVYDSTKVKGVAAITAAGSLKYKPVYEEAGKSFTFEIIASDGHAKDTTETIVTVGYAKALGDVNLSGSVTSADAIPVLEYVVKLRDLTPEQKYYADVNKDGVVGAIDAAWILYAAGHNGTFPTAKSIAASGNVEFGQFTSEKGNIVLPINLKETKGVLSVYTEINVGSEVEFKNVVSKLPEGWIVSSNFENGVLKLAMAGTEALNSGNYAIVNLALANKEAVVTIDGSAKLNDEVTSQIAAKIREIPAEFALSQNYPNPFNPTTSIKYQLAKNANVKLVVYNMLGQVVKSLVNQEQEAGYYTIKWNGTNDFGGKVSSGIYIYRIIAGDFISTVKMNLLK